MNYKPLESVLVGCQENARLDHYTALYLNLWSHRDRSSFFFLLFFLCFFLTPTHFLLGFYNCTRVYVISYDVYSNEITDVRRRWQGVIGIKPLESDRTRTKWNRKGQEKNVENNSHFKSVRPHEMFVQRCVMTRAMLTTALNTAHFFTHRPTVHIHIQTYIQQSHFLLYDRLCRHVIYRIRT